MSRILIPCLIACAGCVADMGETYVLTDAEVDELTEVLEAEAALDEVSDPLVEDEPAIADADEQLAIEEGDWAEDDAGADWLIEGDDEEIAGRASALRSRLGALRDPCETARPTKKGTPGNDHLVGGPGRDVIFGLGGNDVIEGLGGNDILCGGAGEDRVFGAAGNDYIDGGLGKDRLHGGPGKDLIHGRNGGDRIRGGSGNDRLYGDVLDDEIWGDRGADLIVGGHGIDIMDGGPGHDWLRGDTNVDEFVGGGNRDTASFMTAMPPGQTIPGITGTQDGIALRIGDGLASGDGYKETIDSIEEVIGSVFADRFWSGRAGTKLIGGRGDDQFVTGPGVAVEGGAGADGCNAAECDPGMEAPDGTPTAQVFVDQRPRDTGLIVLGAPGMVRDRFEIIRSGDAVRVFTTDGEPIAVGAGCTAISSSRVECTFRHPLRYIMVWTGAGGDRVEIHDGLPRDNTTHVGGGPGDDELRGGDGQDVLFGGISGHDQMYGRGGDDALISESPGGPPMSPEDYAFHGGPDHLDGGNGDDQLVSDYPCGAHHFIGGNGNDIAGFARVGTSFPTAGERHRMRIHAQLGGDVQSRQPFHGFAFQPEFCGFRAFGTRLAGDLEVLEGAGGDDELHGNRLDNRLWGWGGDDRMYGDGGDDILEGHLGDDRLFGENGRDRLRGGDGRDHLDAQDGTKDYELSCGDMGGTLQRDDNDPPADHTMCN